MKTFDINALLNDLPNAAAEPEAPVMAQPQTKKNDFDFNFAPASQPQPTQVFQPQSAPAYQQEPVFEKEFAFEQPAPRSRREKAPREPKAPREKKSHNGLIAIVYLTIALIAAAAIYLFIYHPASEATDEYYFTASTQTLEIYDLEDLSDVSLDIKLHTKQLIVDDGNSTIDLSDLDIFVLLEKLDLPYMLNITCGKRDCNFDVEIANDAINMYGICFRGDVTNLDGIVWHTADDLYILGEISNYLNTYNTATDCFYKLG